MGPTAAGGSGGRRPTGAVWPRLSGVGGGGGTPTAPPPAPLSAPRGVWAALCGGWDPTFVPRDTWRPLPPPRRGATCPHPRGTSVPHSDSCPQESGPPPPPPLKSASLPSAHPTFGAAPQWGMFGGGGGVGGQGDARGGGVEGGPKSLGVFWGGGWMRSLLWRRHCAGRDAEGCAICRHWGGVGWGVGWGVGSPPVPALPHSRVCGRGGAEPHCVLRGEPGGCWGGRGGDGCQCVGWGWVPCWDGARGPMRWHQFPYGMGPTALLGWVHHLLGWCPRPYWDGGHGSLGWVLLILLGWCP